MGLISRVSSRTYRNHNNMSSNKVSKAPSFSKETQDLLKLMMKEAHITNQQRREMTQAMKNNGSLPANLPGTYKKKNPPKKPQPKPAPSPGSTISGYKLRTEEEIRKTGDLDREMYRGAPIPKSRELVKDELNNMMAYGVKEIPTNSKQTREPEKPKTKYQILTDRFEELNADVKDCEQFIEEMKGVPGGQKEIPAVKVQIAMKKKEMQDIDKEMKRIEDS